MGQQTIDKRIAAESTLARIAQGKANTLDKWEAVTIILYIDHLQSEERHWQDMYNREAIRYADARPTCDVCGAVGPVRFIPDSPDPDLVWCSDCEWEASRRASERADR